MCSIEEKITIKQKTLTFQFVFRPHEAMLIYDREYFDEYFFLEKII